MSGSGNNSSTGECSTFGTSDAKCAIIIGSRRALSILSLISCIFVIFVLITLKRYKFLPQCLWNAKLSSRLILYLTIAVFFHTIHYVWADYHIAYQARNGENEGFCIFQGFYHILTGWIAFVWVCIITFNIFWITVFLRRTGKRFERVYIAVDLMPPVILSVIPFFVDAYGPAGIWCWISSRKNKRKFAVGVALQFTLFYGPWMVLCVIMAVVLISVTCLIYYRLRKTGRSKEYGGPMVEAQKGLWSEEIKPLMPFPWIYIATFIFPIVNRLRLAAGLTDPTTSTHFALWFLHAVSLPLPGFFFALVIILDKRIRKDLKQKMPRWCICNKRMIESAHPGDSINCDGKHCTENKTEV